MDDFPDRTFETDDELAAALQEMDIVQKEPVMLGNQPSLYYKGLRYRKTGHEASIVGKDYTVVQNPDILEDLRQEFQNLAITPRGRIQESHRGLLHATLHFFNPNYEVARLVGAIDDATSCYLGILVTNSHGAPALCLSLEAMAESSDGTQYLVSDFLGQRRVRHVGRLRSNFRDLVREMITALPDLGQHIRDAKATALERSQCVQALQALEYGPRVQEAVLTPRVKSAWDLFDALCRHARRSTLRPVSRLAELRRIQGLLDPFKLHKILERGQQLQQEALAMRESNGQTCLPEVAA